MQEHSLSLVDFHGLFLGGLDHHSSHGLCQEVQRPLRTGPFATAMGPPGSS